MENLCIHSIEQLDEDFSERLDPVTEQSDMCYTWQVSWYCSITTAVVGEIGRIPKIISQDFYKFRNNVLYTRTNRDNKNTQYCRRPFWLAQRWIPYHDNMINCRSSVESALSALKTCCFYHTRSSQFSSPIHIKPLLKPLFIETLRLSVIGKFSVSTAHIHSWMYILIISSS